MREKQEFGNERRLLLTKPPFGKQNIPQFNIPKQEFGNERKTGVWE